MIIAVDAMGGDFAPQVVVEGAVRSAAELPAEIALVGQPDRVQHYLSQLDPPDNLQIIAADDVIEMEADPTRGVLGRRDSSMFVAVEMVRRGEAEAVVSTGNSGALLTISHTRLGVIEGLRRPGIAAPVITLDGPGILIDAGANVDCQPIHLAHFGLMGSIYAQYALKIDNPRVGLLNIGSEPTKGNALARQAFELLSELPINFIGNIETDDVFEGNAEIVVADGFVGNVTLKMTEAVTQFVMEELRRSCQNSLSAKIGAFLLRGRLGRLRERYDYATYGGALLLGVQGISVVGHGRSDSKAVANAISVAYRAVKGGVVHHLRETCNTLVASPT